MAEKLLRFVVYDIETLSNLSTFCFLDVETKKTRQFVIHDTVNQFKELSKFIDQLRKLGYFFVGFNNIAFDGQVVHWMMNNKSLLNFTGDQVAKAIRIKAQQLIDLPENERFGILVPEEELYIRQIDLYKQKHYDGKAKRTSLKWLEFTMKLDNIEEMPIAHDQPVNAADIDKVLSYNWNDVWATYEFFMLNQHETTLRLRLSETFGVPILNASEPRMAREILAKLLAQDMSISVKDLKEKRTFRKEIHLGKCIIPIVQFEDEAFKELVKKIRGTTINAHPGADVKGSFSHSMFYKGIKIDYGVGGVHGAVDSGVYYSDEEYVIKTVDVTSFYPCMIINYGFAPAHLGKTFANRYVWFFNERKKYAKKDPINYIYKIILNATYGLSNDVNSFLYDPLTTMKTTINGQLLLSMLAERLSRIGSSQLLVLNTDGLEIRIPRKAEEQFQQICKDWEVLTGLFLEHEEYDKMIFSDVNNYIGVFAERAAKDENDWNKLKESEPLYLFRQGEAMYLYQPVKLKGRFEIKLDWHKNPSALIVPKAVYGHFVRGQSVEDVVQGCESIHDFCFGVKKKADFELMLHYVKSGEYIRDRQQKVCRYYVSTDGGKLIKEYNDGRLTNVNASALVTPCNRISNDKVPDNLNRKWYIEEAYKEIREIEAPISNQLALF